MLRGRNPLVEDRNPDRLNVLPRPAEGRNIQERVDADAVPAEENHRPWKLLRPLLQLSDEILLFRDLNQTPHLVLMGGRQILQPVDALVDVRQRQEIQQSVEWR